MRDLLDGFQPWVDDWDGEEPEAVLHARRQDGDFGEKALVGRARHDLVRIPLTPRIRPHQHHRRTQVLEEMPPLPRDSEEIDVVAHGPQDLVGRVVLEEEVHVYPNPAQILEDMALLHVLRITPVPVEDVVVVETADLRDLREGFADAGLVEVRGVVVEEGVADVFVEFGAPGSVFAVLLAARLRPLLEGGDIFPQPISIDLSAQPDLGVKPSTLRVLEQNIFPH